MKVKCSYCQKIISIPDEYTGKDFKCPHCHQVSVAAPVVGVSETPVTEKSDSQQSSRNLWIFWIAVAAGLAVVIGFIGGVLLTKPNREKTKLEAKVEGTRITTQKETQVAEAEIKRLQNELKRVTDEAFVLRTSAQSPQETINILKSEVQRLSVIVKSQEEIITKLQEENNNLKKQIEDFSRKPKMTTVDIPFTGEETPLSKILAYPENYMGKPFIAIGWIKLKDYFNYGYDDAKNTHVSLYFREIGQSMTSTGVSADLYLKKELSRELVEILANTAGAGHSGKIIRVKASILPSRYEKDSSGIMAELLNWQFLTPDRKTWGDWAVSNKMR